MSSQPAEHFREIGGHEFSDRMGYRPVLDHAHPDTNWSRVAAWCVRARKEGML